MTNIKKAFQRKEKKYLLSLENYQALRQELATYLTEDEYGLHTISSLYYDTANYDLIRESLEKPIYREKFRLRAYGTPCDQTKVFLELKKKFKGIVYKRRLPLTYQSVETFLDGTESLSYRTKTDEQIGQEISWFNKRHQLTPKVLIAYDRIALFDETDNDFRVTFDFNVRWRNYELDLTKGSDGQLVAPEIYCLMEVKALGSYPHWFAKVLTHLQIYPGNFTKYGQTYQRYLFKKEDFCYAN